eukprot:14510847-Heterocapsa_arctica.AAC.1
MEREDHSLYHNLYLMGGGRKLDPTHTLTQAGIEAHSMVYVSLRNAIRGGGTKGSPQQRRKPAANQGNKEDRTHQLQHNKPPDTRVATGGASSSHEHRTRSPTRQQDDNRRGEGRDRSRSPNI